MTRKFLLGLAALTLTVPVAAQKQQPTAEDRLYRLEKQTRQLQRQVGSPGTELEFAL